MPRLKRPHQFKVTDLPFDPETPYSVRRAVYSRLSDDDDDSVSHDVQNADSFAWCKAHGMVPVRVYQDWRTGFDPKRIAWNKMFDDALKGEHAGVVFYDDTRFHRGLKGAYPVVVFHDEKPSYEFDATAVMYDIDKVAYAAQRSGEETETTRRRSMSQRRERSRRGQLVTGKKPYWLERDAARKPLVIQERAAAMLEAIDRYARGERLGSIAKWMTASAPPAPGRPDMWTSGRVRQNFRNPALWGDLPYARVKEETERRNGEVFVVGRSVNPDAVPLKVPPLIHRTDLERVECVATGGCERDGHITGAALDALISGNNLNKSGRIGRTDHPLRRRVVCSCGWRMGFRQAMYKGEPRDYGYLVCTREHQRGVSIAADVPDCPNDYTATRALWAVVQAQFANAVRHPDGVIAAVEAAILSAAAQQARTAEEDAHTLEVASARLAALEERENDLYVDWKAGDISKATYDRQRTLMTTQRMQHEEAKRQVLDRRQILETAATATTRLREGLIAAAELSLDGDVLEWKEWTGLFDRLVQDVVLDAAGTPTLRWRRG